MSSFSNARQEHEEIVNRADLDDILEEVQFAYFGGASADSVAAQMRSLALAHHLPALDFLIRCLRDQRPEWRTQALMLLGNHYDLLDHEKGLEALRGVLRQDADSQLRRKAADFLALYTTWPEQALIDALRSDPDIDVRFAALQAILELTGVPRTRIRDEIGMLRANRMQPTIGDVERISQAGRAT